MWLHGASKISSLPSPTRQRLGPDCAADVSTSFAPAAQLVMQCVFTQVYYISKCSLKIANKQYTSVKNDYEMTLNGESSIILCEDSCDVPMVQCDFVAINDLENKEKDSIVGKDTRASLPAFTSPWKPFSRLSTEKVFWRIQN